MSDATEYIDSIARTLWANAWAEWADTQPDISLSGVEVFDVLPETPADYWVVGLDYAFEVVEANGAPLAELHERTKQDTGEYDDPKTIVHYLTMQGLGHGVGLWEESDLWSAHAGGPLVAPMVEAPHYGGAE